jgi:hypothetical protein
MLAASYRRQQGAKAIQHGSVEWWRTSASRPQQKHYPELSKICVRNAIACVGGYPVEPVSLTNTPAAIGGVASARLSASGASLLAAPLLLLERRIDDR